MFEITVSIPTPTPVKAEVELYYTSDQVERYRVHFGPKQIRIEFKIKEKLWKILGANYDYNPAKFSEILPQIISQIERHNNPPKKYVHPKNAK